MKILHATESTAQTSISKNLAAADNHFGFELLKQLAHDNLATKNNTANILISPASIAWAFHLVLNGAIGPTQDELRKALEISGISLDQLNATNAVMAQELEKADPQVKLEVANSLWAKAGVQFLPTFLNVAERSYRAKIATLKNAAQVNAWVSEKTRGKITSILDQKDITPETLLVLVNALYFKGPWQEPFNKDLTKPQPFHLLNESSKNQPFMHRSDEFIYYQDPQLQAIRLPYGEGRIHFWVVLPATTNTIKNLIESMDATQWTKLTQRAKLRRGHVALPRFQVEYGAGLIPPLEAMGIKIAFTDAAQFSDLAQWPGRSTLKISSIEHKTFLKVDEEGSEAAAVTSIAMRATSAPPSPEQPFEMVVDRPFFVAIQDGSTGLVLFMGMIVDPQ